MPSGVYERTDEMRKNMSKANANKSRKHCKVYSTLSVYKLWIDTFPEISYYGCTYSVRNRMDCHKSKLKYNVHPNYQLQRTFNELNCTPDNIQFKLVSSNKKEYSLELERYFIDNCPNTFNMK